MIRKISISVPLGKRYSLVAWVRGPNWRQVLRLATAAGGGAYRNFGKTCSPSKRIVRSTSSTGMSPMLTRRLNWVTPAST